eukprot:PhM_4_TR18830/c1_g1_i4/m.39758
MEIQAQVALATQLQAQVRSVRSRRESSASRSPSSGRGRSRKSFDSNFSQSAPEAALIGDQSPHQGSRRGSKMSSKRSSRPGSSRRGSAVSNASASTPPTSLTPRGGGWNGFENPPPELDTTLSEGGEAGQGAQTPSKQQTPSSKATPRKTSSKRTKPKVRKLDSLVKDQQQSEPETDDETTSIASSTNNKRSGTRTPSSRPGSKGMTPRTSRTIGASEKLALGDINAESVLIGNDNSSGLDLTSKRSWRAARHFSDHDIARTERSPSGDRNSPLVLTTEKFKPQKVEDAEDPMSAFNLDAAAAALCSPQRSATSPTLPGEPSPPGGAGLVSPRRTWYEVLQEAGNTLHLSNDVEQLVTLDVDMPPPQNLSPPAGGRVGEFRVTGGAVPTTSTPNVSCPLRPKPPTSARIVARAAKKTTHEPSADDLDPVTGERKPMRPREFFRLLGAMSAVVQRMHATKTRTTVCLTEVLDVTPDVFHASIKAGFE